ncbi:MAG TPA: hypothetical protein VNP04_07945 [Alphaproteobacteria bacterium]|nr:hypothetical protein [Alphaproteobacteria bacterium]
MPFELRDFHDLVRLLRDNPEWREELRALLLTQELLTLPTMVAQLILRLDQLTETVARLVEGQEQLTEGQQRLTDTVAQLTVRLDQLTERVAELSVRQDQLTQTVAHLTVRLDQLTERVAELSVRQDQLTETVAQLTVRLDRLTETVAQLTVRLDQLTETVARLAEGQERLADGQHQIEVQMGEMRGWFLEQRYRTYAAAYFGRFLRQVQLAHIGRLADALKERLAEEDVAEVLLAHLILTGRLPRPAGPLAIWVVLEVSATIDRRDVERAQRRAGLLRQARYAAVAVAAGVESTAGARRAASEAGVALLLDGRIDGWQQAIEHMLAEEETGEQSC